jgi:hypothetical protein
MRAVIVLAGIGLAVVLLAVAFASERYGILLAVGGIFVCLAVASWLGY